MKGFVCKTCGYISINGSAPEKCPVCFSPKKVFVEEDAIKLPKDEITLTEKHTPVIDIKKCELVNNKCKDVHVMVGDVIHPMLPEHYIVHMDFYVDKEFVARVHLSPDVNPAAMIHIKAKKGKISVIEFCNLHGAWIKEVKL